MELNSINLSAISAIQPIAVSNSDGNQPKPESKNQSSVSKNQMEEAVILDISPEGLQKSRSNQSDSLTSNRPSGTTKDKNGSKLSDADQQQIKDLETRDLHVKMHEQQHLANAGGYTRGGPTFEYQTGPNGKAYAVGGEVQIDLSPVADNPQATIAKAQTIRRAALAPSDPSGADRSVAASATNMENQARAELQQKTLPKTGEIGDHQPPKDDSRSNYYVKSYQSLSRVWSLGNRINKVA